VVNVSDDRDISEIHNGINKQKPCPGGTVFGLMGEL
jgi:hypothetical protein